MFGSLWTQQLPVCSSVEDHFLTLICLLFCDACAQIGEGCTCLLLVYSPSHCCFAYLIRNLYSKRVKDCFFSLVCLLFCDVCPQIGEDPTSYWFFQTIAALHCNWSKTCTERILKTASSRLFASCFVMPVLRLEKAAHSENRSFWKMFVIYLLFNYFVLIQLYFVYTVSNLVEQYGYNYKHITEL